ncbi:MAG: hypothetical protein KGN84_12525 [Acidobacteriota bacterium]|nr:hypothetical protein [Acidobacteriota bacterium]
MNHQRMTCPLSVEGSAELLLDYSAGRLDPARAALVERHVDSCGVCGAFVADQTGLWQTLDEWKPEAVSMDFNRRLWGRIDSLGTQPWRRRLVGSLRLGSWKPAIPLAAVALVVAAGYMMDHRAAATAGHAAGTGAGVTVIQADQVEKTLDDIQLLKQLDAAGTDAGGSRTL